MNDLNIYLSGFVCMIFLILLLLASLRACKNFNKGLAKHCKFCFLYVVNVALLTTNGPYSLE